MSTSTYRARPTVAALLAGLTMGCSSNEQSTVTTLDCSGAGAYELTVPLGSATLQGRLDLVCLDGRAWGRLTVALPGDALSAAVARPPLALQLLRSCARS